MHSSHPIVLTEKLLLLLLLLLLFLFGFFFCIIASRLP